MVYQGCNYCNANMPSNQMLSNQKLPNQMLPMNQMPNQMPTNQMPMNYGPGKAMPYENLEDMYPDVYRVMQPCVVDKCDRMGIGPGMICNPTKEELDIMADEVVVKVEKNVYLDMDGEEEGSERQPIGTFGGTFGRRRVLRDLATILLIRELIRRRSPYSYGYGYPGYFGYPIPYGYPVY